MKQIQVSIDLSNYVTVSTVIPAASNLANSAPTTLDTLKELADALGSDPNFAVPLPSLVGASN